VSQQQAKKLHAPLQDFCFMLRFLAKIRCRDIYTWATTSR